jgi:hypothetical protein
VVNKAMIAAGGAAAVGFVLVVTGSGVVRTALELIASSLGDTLLLGGAFAIALPLASWPLLRLARARPAGVIATLAPALLYLIFVFAGTWTGPATDWHLGLAAAAAYAITGATVTALSRNTRPPAGR